MPEIEIRPATSADIPIMADLDHDYVSDFVWQMEVQRESGQKPTDIRTEIIFRQLKLPRSLRVTYPRPVSDLAKDWKERSCLLVAMMKAAMALSMSPLKTTSDAFFGQDIRARRRIVARDGISRHRVRP